MSRLFQPAALSICLLLPLCCAAQDRSSYDPMARQAPKRQESLTDFALKQVNTCDKDYGQQVEDLRRVAIEQSVENMSFWTSSLAVIGLISCFAIILHQNKDRQRREIIAAGLLAQIHNAWVESRARVLGLTAQYNGLVESCNVEQESESKLRPQTGEEIHGLANVADGGALLMGPLPHRGGVRRGGNQATDVVADPALPNSGRNPERESGKPSKNAEGLTPISDLQQQLSASRERVIQLEQQLNRSQRLLQVEQQRNNKLKGP
jgi:hypothetical protein